jgi:hypothetical protein
VESVYFALGILAWIIARITISGVLIGRKVGLTRRHFGKRFPRLNRYGLFFQPYVEWCEPISELPQRMVMACRLHLRVQAGAVLFAGLLAFAFRNVGPDRLVGAFFVGLALIEVVWLFANLVVAEGGFIADIERIRKYGPDYAALAPYNLLTQSHKRHRPKNWPADLVAALDQKGLTASTTAVTAPTRYTWANDVGDSSAKASAVADMEYALRDRSVPQQYRSFAAAVYAYHLVSEGRDDEADEWIVEAGKVQRSNETWVAAARAWRDVHGGRLPEARTTLDSVWREVADSDEMKEYALDQIRRIMPTWSAPDD